MFNIACVAAHCARKYWKTGAKFDQHENYFLGRGLPKAAVTSFFFIRAAGLPRSPRFCSSVPSPIMPGWITLACFLLSPAVADFFVMSDPPCEASDTVAPAVEVREGG